MDLADADFADQVRFQLPMCVGQRYGHLPTNMVGAKQTPAERFRVSVDIYMKGNIQRIISPTHPDVGITAVAPSADSSNLNHHIVRFQIDFSNPFNTVVHCR